MSSPNRGPSFHVCVNGRVTDCNASADWCKLQSPGVIPTRAIRWNQTKLARRNSSTLRKPSRRASLGGTQMANYAHDTMRA